MPWEPSENLDLITVVGIVYGTPRLFIVVESFVAVRAVPEGETREAFLDRVRRTHWQLMCLGGTVVLHSTQYYCSLPVSVHPAHT